MWTHFLDMHSGGCLKEKPYRHIFIEAPIEEAKVIFFNRFKHNPERVTCPCCGGDYSIREEKTLEQLTVYHRNCAYAYFDPKGKECPEKKAWVRGKGITKGYKGEYVERQDEQRSKYSFGKYQTLKEFVKNEDILIIYAKDIKPKERKGKIPKQGYVWVG